MPWAAAAAVAGAAISADASGKASKAQGKAAREAAELERETRDLTRADNAPYLQRGNQAGNRLQYLMGLDAGSGGASGSSGAAPLDRETLRNKLVGQYTRSNTTSAPPVPTSGWSPDSPGIMDGVGVEGNSGRFIGGSGTSSIDEAGLNAEIDRQMAEAEAQRAAQAQANEAAAQNDPAYGSLMRKFTMADRDADPVYQSGLQFGLNEGTKAINNRAGAGGSFLSGATLKALTRFGNDYGSTKAGESYNRFTNDQTSQYNKLAGIVGTGQTATAQVGAANNAYGARAGDYLTQGGNAAAAGYMGQGNALTNGINSGYNAYQENVMNKIRNPGGSPGWGSAGGWSGGGRVVPDYPGAEY